MLAVVAIAVGMVAGAMSVLAATAIQDPEPGDLDNHPADTEMAEAFEVSTEIRSGGVLHMRQRGGLDEAILAQVLAIDGVASATLVRTDIVGLTGSRAEGGEAVDVLDDGWRIPVAIGAIEPTAYAYALAEIGDKQDHVIDSISSLAPGSVLLSDSGAALRGVGVGGELDLADVAGLRVVGIVPDGTVRRAEIILHVDDASRLDMTPGGGLVITHDAAHGEDTDRLMEQLAALIAEDDDNPPRVTDHHEEAERERSPLVLQLTEIKSLFGEFSYRPRPGMREIDIERRFVDNYIVTEAVPGLGNVTCHREIMPDLRSALDQIIDAGLEEHLNPSRYAGCHYPRRISTDRERLSNHSWGIAIDINVDLSHPGLGPVPPDEFIEIFAQNGFRWGGDFTTPDNHHYEWVGPAAMQRPSRSTSDRAQHD